MTVAGRPLDRTRPRTAIPPAAPEPRTSRWSVPVPGSWVAACAAAWLVYFTATLALTPAPTDPAAVSPAVETAVGLVVLAVIAAVAFGLASGRRIGLAASLGGGALLLADAVACPATGHHAVGPWWFGQLALAVTLVAVSAVAVRRTRPH